MAKSTSKSGSNGNGRKSSSNTSAGKGRGTSGSKSAASRSTNNSRKGVSARGSNGSNGRANTTSKGTTSARNSSSSKGRTASSGSNSAGSNEGLMKLFTEQLQDIYYVEKQLVRSLSRMAKAANSDELRTAFEEHRTETETQMERLEEVFEMLDRDPKGKKCEAMDGLLEEAKELIEDFSDDRALDAALVAAAQKVEHYEIATYGSLCAWAEQLGLDEAVPLLEETLQEEKQTDQNLTELAVSMLNEQGEQDRDEMETTRSGGSSGSR